MHRNIILLSLVTLLLTGCSWLFYDRYQEFNDEFKNSRKTIARMEIRPLEPRTEIGYAKIIFEREFSDKNDLVKAYFVIDRSSSSFKIDNQGFIRIDDISFNITFEDILSEQKMKTETSTSSYLTTDSTTVSSGSTVDSDSRIWIDDKFLFTLSEDMIEKIKTSDNIIFRFYFGPIPGTFRIKGTDLKFVKKILLD
jgi:hypothetical protein